MVEGVGFKSCKLGLTVLKLECNLGFRLVLVFGCWGDC